MPGGERRDGSGVGAAGSRVPSIPRCGLSSPFRGHMSTKSNAFCIGQSSRLSDQFRIRDHMMIHYNKILTAKPAVDCSAPKSMVKSIKYSDQQRREKMKKEVVRLERGVSRSGPPSRPHSRESLDSASLRKEIYAGYSHLLRHSPYSDPGPLASPTSFTSPPRHFQSPEPMADHSRRHTNLSTAPSRLGGRLSSSHSLAAAARTFQDNCKKTYSGDLLEKHAHYFTDRQHPFILKTQAQSVLANSRHYTPPRRKRRGAAREAKVQTEINRGKHRPADGSPPMNGEQEDETDHLLLSEEEDVDHLQLSPASERISPSPRMQRIQSEEEQLAYLDFVSNVTSEIVTLGLVSDRALDRVFQRHFEANRHRLDEGKMRHLLDILRTDLDSKDEKNIDLLDDLNLQSSTPTRDPLAFQDVVRTDGFHRQNFSSVRQSSGQSQGAHSYLHARENGSWLRDDVLISLDTGDDKEASTSLNGLDETYVINHLKNNVLSSQEDTEATHLSLEAASSVPENKSDASQLKDDSLPLSGHQEEVKLEPQEIVEIPEKTSSLDNALPEDRGENRRSPSLGATLVMSSSPEPAHASDTTNQLNDLEDLEKSFSDVIHVSKAEDEIDLEEKMENAASEQDNSDDNEF